MSDSRHEPPRDIKAGEKPGDSIRELTHPEENNGPTEAEQDRRQANVDEAARRAQELHDDPDNHGRQGL